ncbi:MAG TPA: NUDIX domain-containing protein [Moheibacter sp.]|nr:NUDIX domain-containing protein [Moheibacter sp.]
MIQAFNIRVYGLLLHQGKLLVIQEKFMDQVIYKFPGGGLEFGEGLHDCLIREFKEELNVKISIQKHLYTQEDFIVSAIHPTEQVLMVYYLVETASLDEMKVDEKVILSLEWKDLDEIKPEDLSLVTEQKVVEILLNQRKTIK